MSRIVRRIFTVLPAVLLQAVWLYLLFRWLAPWSAVLNTVLSVLALFLVLYLIMKREESTYKILWLLVILPFPLPGALLYLLFGNKRTTGPLKKKLAKATPLPPDGTDPETVYGALEAENERLAQTFRWLERKTGFAPQENRGAVYYPLGDDMFPDMLAALKEAERFIFLEYFIIENGRMWDAMTEILAEKAASGVDVRVLYDDLGSISTYTKKDAEKLREKGIRCVAFNPLLFIRGTLNCRDHRKMLIVDGKVVFSGGINLADEYINGKVKHGHWKDIGFRMTGGAVSCYVRMFAQFWNAFEGEPIPEAFLVAAPAAPAAIADSGSRAADGQAAVATAAAPAAPAALGDGYVLSYYDSPLREDACSNELYVDLLSQAKQTAWFYTPYLMPGDALLAAFIRAAQRGVDVRIIMPGIPDKKLIFRMSRSFYPPLLEAGVRIFEYTPGFVHAKACLVDGAVGTVGTVNLDYRSLFLHFENNSLFYRASLLESLKADFLATQAQCAERTAENIGKGFGKWFLDGVLRIFAPLC